MLRNNGDKSSSVIDLFESKELITMCAPMVRYSKLPFRMLVRKYGCDVAFTPMIISRSFVESEKARHSDFTTAAGDRPLIVQFAANNGIDFADATEIVCRYSDGVDLNCGCPQSWVLADGYGACLLSKPELVQDMIQQVRNRISDAKYTVSLKIRLHDDIRHSIEFCRQAQQAGASWISVHGRTKSQRNEPVNVDAIKLIKESLTIPVIGNGDIFSLTDALRFHKQTGVNGVMSARGLLQNPSLFCGTEVTSSSCIKDWINLSLSFGATFTNIHHHLMFMLEKIMPRSERKLFNSYTCLASVLDHLNEFSF
ncbi:tRNA-dihydrouridine(20a/20b) synthase [NAD(P)+]-like [Araneus ventricosus]|uniref:tRNA-dihydrouridine synthase n=1 Tax=Araneus ventricosus TaxID=182803 RepID=A0A4Y2AS35_ARAVE|nr:tRNA-dihydrouridine(20a/20b) synthase [NAD(P)+]-like [Araneus ventricosus]